MAKDIVSTNDERVLELKKLVDAKREKLKGRTATRYKAKTTCMIDLDGVRHNFNVLNKKQLTGMLVRLHTMVLAAEDLEIDPNVVELSGFPLTDWITDVKGKLEEVSVREEEADLKKAEAALDKLLSAGKKVELELNAMEAFLKG